ARPPTNNPQRKFKTAALNTETTKTRYEELVTSRLEVLSERPDIETSWKQCMEVVKTTVTEILGMQKPQRISGWRDEEYEKTIAYFI
ncbi:hypothetical protein ABN196_17970, partial [Proteus terrae]|uniref:hypothetical protein n=1 Tax=Proteus terrae TaxID=1574161 RepID=UPI0032DB8D47